MHEIQKFILKNVSQYPDNIVSLAAEKFGVSRTAVFFHMKKLKESGLIHQEGTRNKSKYYLAPDKEPTEPEITFDYEVGKSGEYEIWKQDIKPNLGPLKKNVEDILQYGFTEMFNNVIDHSESKTAFADIKEENGSIVLTIHDWGVGVFAKIASFFNIQDMREAVIKLHQGKVTTDASKHSGQGIFFTSRAVDWFVIMANGFRYIKNNAEDDEWYWEKQENEDKGTSIRLKIRKDSPRILKDVFDAFTNPDNYKFDRSHIRIELGNYEEDYFISRSQAKRLLAGLTDFKTVTMDFKNIRNVGQAFVDEVFGVFGLENPDIHFSIINANEDVLFMIKRGLSNREFPQDRITF